MRGYKKTLFHRIAVKILRVLLGHRWESVHCWKILSKSYGHLKSGKEWSSVTASGDPVPWITYPAMDFLKQFDFSKKRIFEYGSGNSTLFWAERAASVVSVESDKEWYARIKKNIPGNVEYIFADSENYAQRIDPFGEPFDFIVIDGHERYRCALRAAEHLAPGGIILLDNSDWHQMSTEYLRSKGFTQIDFIGFAPIVGFISCTSIFFKGGFSLPQLEKHRPDNLFCGVRSIERF